MRVQSLWRDLQGVPFPSDRRLHAETLGTWTDPTLVDSDIAGCSSTFVRLGTLDVRRAAILGLRCRDASILAQRFEDATGDYFKRLEQLAREILNYVEATTHDESQR